MMFTVQDYARDILSVHAIRIFRNGTEAHARCWTVRKRETTHRADEAGFTQPVNDVLVCGSDTLCPFLVTNASPDLAVMPEPYNTKQGAFRKDYEQPIPAKKTTKKQKKICICARSQSGVSLLNHSPTMRATQSKQTSTSYHENINGDSSGDSDAGGQRKANDTDSQSKTTTTPPEQRTVPKKMLMPMRNVLNTNLPSDKMTGRAMSSAELGDGWTDQSIVFDKGRRLCKQQW